MVQGASCNVYASFSCHSLLTDISLPHFVFAAHTLTQLINDTIADLEQKVRLSSGAEREQLRSQLQVRFRWKQFGNLIVLSSILFLVLPRLISSRSLPRFACTGVLGHSP